MPKVKKNTPISLIAAADFAIQLSDFLASKKRNGWLSKESSNFSYKVYMRKSTRRLVMRDVKCLDIANIIIEPSGNGIFTSILSVTNILLLDSKWHAIYIENVTCDRFACYFRSRQWIEVGNSTNFVSPCFYKDIGPMTDKTQ